jgi:hypothetical protein
MIDWLRVAKSAHFYRRKRARLSAAVIAKLFRDLRNSYLSPSNNIFMHVNQAFGHAHWSAISFFYERQPSFLELPPGVNNRERVCGFLLIVEYRGCVVVFKSGLEFPASFKSRFLERIGNEHVEGAIARADATFEKIRLRNMPGSKYALRAKTLEAIDLQSVVGPSGASRYIPQGYRVKRGDEHYSATPSTGRISLRSDRAGHQDLVNWSVSVIDALIVQNPQTAAFIKTFARPSDLGSIPPGTLPTFAAVDMASLVEELFESEEKKHLVRDAAGGPVVLDKAATDAVLAALDQSFEIRRVKKELRIIDPATDQKAGEIVIGKTRISLRSFELPEIVDVFVESEVEQPGGGERSPLKRYIDQNDLLTVLFSDFNVAYINGALFRDDRFADGGGSFLQYIRANAALANVTSEKGNFAAGQQQFSNESVFQVVVDSIAAADDVLVCDDLVDEWADFIGICCSTRPKTVSFYHAKHGSLSLGAGPFHIAVSQAIKNLGRMALDADTMVAKFARWSNNYQNDNVATQIPRRSKGDAPVLEQAVADVRSSPDTIRRVFIVTSSLSRQQLENTFAAIRAGTSPRPHFVQLYWLLMAFFSACLEVGAYPYVICQP